VDLSPGYREFAAPAPAGRSVSCLWVRVPDRKPPVLVLPDACIDLIWQQGKGAFIAGPDTGPAPSELGRGDVLVGARFRPGAGGPALGMPLSVLLDQRVGPVELERDLAAGPAGGMARVLPGSLAPEVALRRVARLAGAMAAAGPPDPLVRAAARHLGRTGAQADRAAAALGVSERQLRRRCQAAVGYGPATLRRVLRFRRFLSRLDAAGGSADLGLLAADAGYADQPHLSRETARLAGLSPAALAATRHPAPP
jgi:AraC-like DNA-binding protein